jgi:hypothetical protein
MGHFFSHELQYFASKSVLSNSIVEVNHTPYKGRDIFGQRSLIHILMVQFQTIAAGSICLFLKSILNWSLNLRHSTAVLFFCLSTKSIGP